MLRTLTGMTRMALKSTSQLILGLTSRSLTLSTRTVLLPAWKSLLLEVDLCVSVLYSTRPLFTPVCSSLRFTGRIDSISAASITVVKKPYTLSRRVLHACHQFIFEPDKALTEGYSPKYRYLPIVSGLVVPVRYCILLAFLSCIDGYLRHP
jgi:hypothetical protein